MKGNATIAIIIIVIVALIGIGMLVNTTENERQQKNIIEQMSFEEKYIEMDLKETRIVKLNIIPQNGDKKDLKYVSTNLEIATFEKSIETNDEDAIYVKIQPISEGVCEVFATCNEIESNKIRVKIVDNERIEREKKEAEEQARKEAEEQARREAEEQKNKQNQSTSSQKNNSNSQTTPKPSSTGSSTSQSNSNNSHGKAVYRTPSGKRYHYDPDCGGKNSYETTYSAAISAGLTACQKCAK